MNKLTLILIAALVFVPAARADLAEIAEEHTDMFRPLILEPKPVDPIPETGPKLVPQPPPPVIIPPVNFTVSALALDGANRVAVIEFEGQTYIVQEGMRIPDNSSPAMEIKSVTDEKVVVHDTRLSKLVTKQLTSN